MNWSEEEIKKIADIICWKLYISNNNSSNDYKQIWSNFVENYPDIASNISDSIVDMWASMWKPTFRFRLLPSTDILIESQNVDIKLTDFLERLWRDFLYRLEDKEREKLREEVFNIVQAIQLIPDSKASIQTDPAYQERSETSKSAISKDSSQSQKAKVTISDQNPVTSTNESINQPPADENNPIPALAQWKYFPVPNDEPDKHDEFYCKCDTGREGLKLIGARVRGKMHKHNGTNCDDWFEFAVSGNWTIIAVSDGAGSRKFSRVGAKASCKAAVKELATELEKYKIKDRDTKEALSTDLTPDANWSFPGEDIQFVQQALHKAMQGAYNAVKKEADKRHEKADYCIALGGKRKLDINDLSATLLLAVHTTVKAGETEYSLILTCQIGDGMIAAISQEGTLKLLGKPDSGDYGGQTEFLTSKNKLGRNNLVQKTFVFPGNLKTLMVMTDGVADDYFPNDPGMLELYGDLVLNKVIGIRQPTDSEIKEQLRETKLSQIFNLSHLLNKVKEVNPDSFPLKEQVITVDGIKEVKISYVDAYAKELGVSPQNVVASSALLWAGATMCDECKDKPPEEKLRIWLDSYYRRGSFDDRTLVILYREEV